VSDSRSDVAVGLFFKDYRSDRYPDVHVGYQIGTYYYFGQSDGRTYCATVRPAWRQAPNNQVRLSVMPGDAPFLGVCDLIRAYGLPGPAVRSWLADGGTALAASVHPSGGSDFFFRDLGDATVARRGFLGRTSQPLGYFIASDHDRCFAGLAAGCAQIFLHPGWTDYGGSGGRLRTGSSPHAPASAVQQRSVFEPADYHVVADLAAEFGPERFMAWWTADGNVADAFQASFGVNVGTWNLRRIGDFLTIAKPGPGVTRSGVLGAVLILALSAIVAGLWARRRQVA